MATLAEARTLGGKLDTPVKATGAILATLKALRAASDQLQRFSFADKAVGLHGAFADRIAAQLARVDVLQSRKYDRKLADAAGLAVAQSRDLLREVATAAKNSEAESTFEAILAAFLAALAKVIGAAIPSWVWLAAAWYLLRDE